MCLSHYVAITYTKEIKKSIFHNKKTKHINLNFDHLLTMDYDHWLDGLIMTIIIYLHYLKNIIF